MAVTLADDHSSFLYRFHIYIYSMNAKSAASWAKSAGPNRATLCTRHPGRTNRQRMLLPAIDTVLVVGPVDAAARESGPACGSAQPRRRRSHALNRARSGNEWRHSGTAAAVAAAAQPVTAQDGTAAAAQRSKHQNRPRDCVRRLWVSSWAAWCECVCEVVELEICTTMGRDGCRRQWSGGTPTIGGGWRLWGRTRACWLWLRWARQLWSAADSAAVGGTGFVVAVCRAGNRWLDRMGVLVSARCHCDKKSMNGRWGKCNVFFLSGPSNQWRFHVEQRT